MASFNVYQLTKEDVMFWLDCSYPSLLRDIKEYVRLVQKATYVEATAREIIYEECLKAFRHSDYITTAKDALEHVYNGSFHKMAKNEVKAIRDVEEKKEKQEEDFRAWCKKKGVDVETERKRRKEAAARTRKIIKRSIIIFLLVYVTCLVVFYCLAQTVPVFGKVVLYMLVFLFVGSFLGYKIAKMFGLIDKLNRWK